MLIRALEPLKGIALMQRRRPLARRLGDLANGPGKLCAALGIDAGNNALSLQQGPLRILAGERVDDADVLISPRVGITKAAGDMLRFYVADNPYVSRVPSSIANSSRKY